MTLAILRLFERTFYGIGSWFEDWADAIDADFQEVLRDEML